MNHNLEGNTGYRKQTVNLPMKICDCAGMLGDYEAVLLNRPPMNLDLFFQRLAANDHQATTVASLLGPLVVECTHLGLFSIVYSQYWELRGIESTQARSKFAVLIAKSNTAATP